MACAPQLLAWTQATGVQLELHLQTVILNGFKPGAAGEDRFDAMTGLLGMLDALLRAREVGELANDRVRSIVGWIFGPEIQTRINRSLDAWSSPGHS